jgi:hypothetical protein
MPSSISFLSGGSFDALVSGARILASALFFQLARKLLTVRAKHVNLDVRE